MKQIILANCRFHDGVISIIGGYWSNRAEPSEQWTLVFRYYAISSRLPIGKRMWSMLMRRLRDCCAKIVMFGSPEGVTDHHHPCCWQAFCHFSVNFLKAECKYPEEESIKSTKSNKKCICLVYCFISPIILLVNV